MKRIGIVGAILAMSAMVVLFQNCGKAGFENSDFASNLGSAVEIDPKLAQLPFPYQVSVNQIAHMSCPITRTNPGTNSPYFSWKVGAFDNPSTSPSARLNIRTSGLQLTPEFMAEWNRVSQSFNPSIRESKLVEALTSLPSIANTRLQMSFRSTFSPQKELMLLPSGEQTAVQSLMAPLTSSGVVDVFKSGVTTPVHAFPNVADFSSRFLEGQMIVPSAYGTQTLALRANYDSSYLALGFAKDSENAEGSNDLIGPSSDERYAYGKGFRIHFGKANPHVGTTLYPSSDSLAVVEEYDLETGNRTAGVGWDCSYKFKIVKPVDALKYMYKRDHFVRPGGNCPSAPVTSEYCASPVDSNFGIHPSLFPGGRCPSNRPLIASRPHCDERYVFTCPPEPYAENPNSPNLYEREDGIYHSRHPQRPAILHALRRFLPGNQWDINVSRRCIVPKVDDNACYSSPNIVYDEVFFPGAGMASLGIYEGCGVNNQYECAAYLTLCVRR